MAVLALFKLGTLAMKTFSKPIANGLKKEASCHPLFRDCIISLLQAQIRLTTRINRQIYGRTTQIATRPLDEEKAVKTASCLSFGGVLHVHSGFLITIGRCQEALKCSRHEHAYFPQWTKVAGATIILELSDSKTKEERLSQELQAIRTMLASMMTEKLGYIGQQVELLAQNQAEVTKNQVELAKNLAELAKNHAEFAKKQDELAKKQAEHAQKQEQLVAELAQKQEQLPARLVVELKS